MSGEQDVAAELLAQREAFLGFLERRLRDRALAEDVLHDALVRSMGELDTLRDRRALVPWFYRVLRNAVIDHQRRRASAARALADFAAELETEQAGTETHGAICRCVTKVLSDSLRPEHAQALTRIEIDGVAVKDYAVEAGITRNHAGVRAFRARDALRKELSASCGACASRGCVDCTCDA